MTVDTHTVIVIQSGKPKKRQACMLRPETRQWVRWHFFMLRYSLLYQYHPSLVTDTMVIMTLSTDIGVRHLCNLSRFPAWKLEGKNSEIENEIHNITTYSPYSSHRLHYLVEQKPKYVSCYNRNKFKKYIL